jgi:dienelactone hydrolase
MKPRSLLVSINALVVVAALALATPTVAGAQTNPYQRGPTPTTQTIEAPTGPYQVATAPVSGQSGFGGGTIYYPTNTNETFGGVVVSPGFVSFSWQMSWMGTRVASQGFVVLTFDTNTLFDFPNSRAQQLKAALNYLTQQSPAAARSRVDPNRLAATGWSMGGGGTLELTTDSTAHIKAAVAFEPWDLFWSYGGDRVPTMIVGAENDTIAPVSSMASPFYASIPAASEKALVVVADQDHFLGSSSNTTQAKYTIAWLKRYLDNDTRYDQFLCPTPSGPTIAQFQITCPMGS